MVTYKIIDGQKNVDPFNQKIKKSGKETKKIDVEFTMADIIENINSFRKTIKEKEGQKKIHAAEMTNVEENHPGLKDIDEKLKQAVYVWIEAKVNHDSNDIVIKQYKEALKELETESDLIQKTVKFPYSVSVGDVKEEDNG